jgi:outer membrane protein OmpA-like peptidoglycan-associated protein
MELVALAQAAGLTARIDVIGHADPSGPRATNEELARLRAEQVANELAARGAPADRMHARGGGVRAGVPSRAADAWRARSVYLRVDLRGAAKE